MEHNKIEKQVNSKCIKNIIKRNINAFVFSNQMCLFISKLTNYNDSDRLLNGGIGTTNS